MTRAPASESVRFVRIRWGLWRMPSAAMWPSRSKPLLFASSTILPAGGAAGTSPIAFNGTVATARSFRTARGSTPLPS